MRQLFNPEAEAVVLATMLHDHHGASDAFSLAPDDFALATHRELFTSMMEEIRAGRPPATAVITMRLKQAGGDAGYIFKISGKVDRGAVPGCVAEIRSLAALRRLGAAAQYTLEAIEEPGTKPADLASAVMQHVNHAMAEIGSKLVPALVDDAAGAFLATLDGTESVDLIPTGFKTLDRAIGGFPRQELTLLAGRPSMGKSAFVASMARKMAQAGHPVALFSLEMPRSAVIARILSELSYLGLGHVENVTYSATLRREINSNQRARLVAARDGLKGLPLLIDDQPGLTMAEIQARAMKFASDLESRDQRLAVVIIDHLGKVKASDRYAGNMVHETGEKSDAMMTLAKMLDVAVLAAQQLNRSVESREDKRPQLSDLRDTGNLEQDAHTVLLLYRAAYYLEREKFDDPLDEAARIADLMAVINQVEILIAKCRNGEIGTKKMFCDLAFNALSDLASEVVFNGR